MEVIQELKPDFLKCLKDNPTWTCETIIQITKALNSVFREDRNERVTKNKSQIIAKTKGTPNGSRYARRICRSTKALPAETYKIGVRDL